MSRCGGNCGCGANCKCDSGCRGCGMDTNVEKTTAATIIDEVAPTKMSSEDSKMSSGAEGGHVCKCTNCTCNPCNC